MAMASAHLARLQAKLSNQWIRSKFAQAQNWVAVCRARVPAVTSAERTRAVKQYFVFFFSSRRRHTRCSRDWSSDVCSSDLATLIVATHLAGGVGSFARAWSAGKLVTLDFTPSFKVLYTFWGGVVGGALLAGASHGTDHLIVQRLLAARGLRDAQRALVGSGV